MGSFNSYPGAEINPELKQKQEIRQEINTGEKSMVSLLINSIYYFIDCVYILNSKNKYRLVALQHNRVLMDKYYHTVRGCKIAFVKLFKDKAWDDSVKANWTSFYDPDKEWLEEKQSFLEN
jgi:hypothetical protein